MSPSGCWPLQSLTTSQTYGAVTSPLTSQTPTPTLLNPTHLESRHYIYRETELRSDRESKVLFSYVFIVISRKLVGASCVSHREIGLQPFGLHLSHRDGYLILTVGHNSITRHIFLESFSRFGGPSIFADPKK